MSETTQDFIEARLVVPRELSDAVCNFIIENITNGIVLDEEDDSIETGISFYVAWDRQEQYKKELETYLAQIISSGPVPVIREQKVQNIEWVEQYKASIKPIVIGEDIVVRPHWAQSPIAASYEIILEPRMAFGTGSHETTRSCLFLLRQRFEKGMRFLDLGTGSGILSILADKMQVGYIKAIDYDLVAVENCRENFELNNVKTRHEILFGSIEKCDNDTPYDIVCANIIKSTILPMLPRLIELTISGGVLVISGLLTEDEPDVREALHALGQNRFIIHPDNRWLTFVVSRA